MNEAVICCVKGARGKGKAGDPCTGEADCLSSLCIDDEIAGKVCSDRCESADDCPVGLKNCTQFPFVDTDLKFCTPSTPELADFVPGEPVLAGPPLWRKEGGLARWVHRPRASK